MTTPRRPPPIRDALPADEPIVAELAEPVLAELADPPLLTPLPENRFLDPALVEPTATPWYEGSPPVVLWRLVCLIVSGVFSAVEWLFGAAVLVVGLAVLAALPIVQVLSLGYLLEAGARVARSGRLRDGFIGVRLAARLGGILLACYLLLIPVRIVSGLATAAHIIDPGGPSARAWRFGLLVLIGLTALHLGLAIARGGRLRYFLWPFNIVWFVRRLFQGGYYVEARDAVWDTVHALRLPYYAWLGFRGYLAAMAWLFVPVTFLVLGHVPVPVAPLVGWAGGLMLAAVVMYLPFAQMRFAETDDLAEAFNLSGIREDYQRAPFLFTLALLVSLLSALPLYLLKIETVPREAAWLPSLLFIVFIFPARLLTGWALARAKRRELPRHWFFRWVAWLPVVPAVLFYVLIVYFTQFTSWNGVWSLYEQHAFLLPVPFFGG